MPSCRTPRERSPRSGRASPRRPPLPGGTRYYASTSCRRTWPRHGQCSLDCANDCPRYAWRSAVAVVATRSNGCSAVSSTSHSVGPPRTCRTASMQRLIRREALGVALPKGHPLAAAEAVAVRELADETALSAARRFRAGVERLHPRRVAGPRDSRRDGIRQVPTAPAQRSSWFVPRNASPSGCSPRRTPTVSWSDRWPPASRRTAGRCAGGTPPTPRPPPWPRCETSREVDGRMHNFGSCGVGMTTDIDRGPDMCRAVTHSREVKNHGYRTCQHHRRRAAASHPIRSSAATKPPGIPSRSASHHHRRRNPAVVAGRRPSSSTSASPTASRAASAVAASKPTTWTRSPTSGWSRPPAATVPTPRHRSWRTPYRPSAAR